MTRLANPVWPLALLLLAGCGQGLADPPPSFTAVSVADLDRSMDWYGDRLGFEVARTLASRDSTLVAAILTRGPAVVELISHQESINTLALLPEGANSLQLRGLAKAGIFVDDLDTLHASLTAAGVEVDNQIGNDPAQNWRFFVVRDPEGNRLQFFELCPGTCP